MNEASDAEAARIRAYLASNTRDDGRVTSTSSRGGASRRERVETL